MANEVIKKYTYNFLVRNVPADGLARIFAGLYSWISGYVYMQG